MRPEDIQEQDHAAEDGYEALRGADALAVVTEWNEFRTPDFKKMKKLMKKQVIFDGRNIYNQEEMKKLGFTYYGIGRTIGMRACGARSSLDTAPVLEI